MVIGSEVGRVPNGLLGVGLGRPGFESSPVIHGSNPIPPDSEAAAHEGSDLVSFPIQDGLCQFGE